jgi:2-dehydro-3-deoxyphosphogluconate aldolase/(4S)-4-hydroxy-2-oxoglutarate aldolase
MNEIFNTIKKLKITPVVSIQDAEFAVSLGKALVKSGLPTIEITFRTAVAEHAIKNIKNQIPEIFIGAGTVLTIEQVDKAVNAGARFIVSPGFNPTVVDYCINNDIVIIPGINSPSMVEWGIERGLKVFKFFPAEVSGGPAFLRALAGPYKDIKFIPTGGINETNILDYLKLDNVLACAGSWLTKGNNLEQIERNIIRVLSLIKSETK